MISNDTLENWGTYPSATEITKTSHTYNMIKNILEKNIDKASIKEVYGLNDFNFKVYLQGSYANSTNVNYESDVDIVIEVVDDVWIPYINNMLETHQVAYVQNHRNTEFTPIIWKNIVFNVLNEHFPDAIEYKSKSIKVAGNSNRINADIIPAMEYRVYNGYIPEGNIHDCIKGISFVNTETNEFIYNFPKDHLDECEVKNKKLSKFKSMVRVFKNIRNDLIANSLIDDKLAPSYHIENLLYNCPDNCFTNNVKTNIINIIKHIIIEHKADNLKHFICANQVHSLYDDSVGWKTKDTINFITKTFTHLELHKGN